MAWWSNRIIKLGNPGVVTMNVKTVWLAYSIKSEPIMALLPYVFKICSRQLTNTIDHVKQGRSTPKAHEHKRHT